MCRGQIATMFIVVLAPGYLLPVSNGSVLPVRQLARGLVTLLVDQGGGTSPEMPPDSNRAITTAQVI